MHDQDRFRGQGGPPPRDFRRPQQGDRPPPGPDYNYPPPGRGDRPFDRREGPPGGFRHPPQAGRHPRGGRQY